jgi:glycosyltransferase involved in cell wall biosynthesis
MTQRQSRPRVSVIINTYNHDRFVTQALRSVAGQDFPARETEIIVVDDGSTDATPKLLNEFWPLIRFIRKENGGQVSAFNAGIEIARGEILAFLDGDDWWSTSKLSRVVAAFDANPNLAAVGHGYYEVTENGDHTATISPERICHLNLESPSDARRSAPFRIFLGTSRLAVRASVIPQVLPVPTELPFFDNFIFTQAVAIGGADILPEPLCYYRIHSGSMYAGDVTNRKRLWTRYRLLCGLLEHLPRRLLSLGVPENTILALLESDFVDRDRLKLILRGGTPFETFRVERADFQISYSDSTPAYRCFKALGLLLALSMPPGVFYKMRDCYARYNLKRFRRWIGEASPSAPQVTRRSSKTKADPADA